MTTDFLKELNWRGLLYQTAGNGLEDHLATPRVGYCGFDPTADSLTVGNYNSINLLRHFQRAGHRPIVIMGGGTGLIGDPSGKDTERSLLTYDQVQANVQSCLRIFDRILDLDPESPNGAIVLNNADWLAKLGYVEVLRDVGKYFSVNAMIQKESVNTRLHNRDQGISYTEFSYMVLQAYDFLYLWREYNCTLQVAGSDQYGNIVAGMDLIRRAAQDNDTPAFGVTSPLVTRADGRKFGKSEEGAIWLTADRTSPYKFYQFWINTEDSKVLDYLRRFTLLTPDEIQVYEQNHHENPGAREAHQKLARELTSLLHGESELRSVERATQALFGKVPLQELELSLLEDVFSDVPHSSHERTKLDGEGVPIVDLLHESSLAQSRREAREFLGNGAVSVNGAKVDSDYQVTARDLLHGKLICLRRGKKNWHATQWA